MENTVTSVINSPKRNYGIDILRMFSMFMVVVLHILGQGGVLGYSPKLSSQYETAWFLETACYCCVNCYALISGYVGVNSKYKYSNIVTLWLQVFFYTSIVTVGYCIYTHTVPDIYLLGNMFFPAVNYQYWYFTAYFAMFFFIPLYNFALNGLTKKQLTVIVFAIFILFSICPIAVDSDIFKEGGGYTFLWLSLMYFVGGYMKKFDICEKINSFIALGVYAVSVIIPWGFKYYFEYTKKKISFSPSILINYISPFILLAGLSLLVIFSKIKVNDKIGKYITLFSSFSFGVYLIHVHPIIWDNIMLRRFREYATYSAPKLALYVIITAFVIFFVLSLVDGIRAFLFKLAHVKPFFQKLENKYVKDLWNKKSD